MANPGFSGELIHFGSIRGRINGSGSLLMWLRSLDNIFNFSTSITMADPTHIEPLVLTNFIEQRAQLECRVSTIDDYFQVSRITIFIRPVATGIPQ